MSEARLSEQTVSEIRLLSDVARVNQNYLSLKDIVLLTSTRLTEAELRAKWDLIPELSSSYKLEEDLLLVLSTETCEASPSAITLVKENKARARDFLGYANAFQAWSRSLSPRLVSISGSTSYFSAKSSDDLDFFVVSAKDHLWIYLAKSLVLARVFRFLHSSSPRICFSYAIDETFAEKTLVEGDPLLARDLLNVVVLQGRDYYRYLVEKSRWISKYFPRLYGLRAGSGSRTQDFRTSRPSPVKKSLNLLLYLVLGQYIRIKSHMLNRQFLRKGKTDSLFIFRAGPDHCIFDSIRYSRLREIYNTNGPMVPRVYRQGSTTEGAI